MTVWKFTLEVTDVQDVAMPVGAGILHVAHQNGQLCIWAQLDPMRGYEMRTFYVVGTGNPVPPNVRYLGSVLADPFVWHVFEQDTAA